MSYTFPSITVQKPPSLLWFSRSALRIGDTSSLFLELWPAEKDPATAEEELVTFYTSGPPLPVRHAGGSLYP